MITIKRICVSINATLLDQIDTYVKERRKKGYVDDRSKFFDRASRRLLKEHEETRLREQKFQEDTAKLL